MASKIIWRMRGGKELSFPPCCVAGILNATPDSFSDGLNGFFGEGLETSAFVEQLLGKAAALLSEGADIIDVGGESTRPGAAEIGPEEEQNRILPLLRGLLSPEFRKENNISEGSAPFAVSVDTWRASTARAALELEDKGFRVEMVNDISGGTFDPAMAEVVACFKPAFVLGHCPERPAVMQNAPVYGNVVEEIYAHFAARLEELVKAGLPEEHIALDPCIGFGKTTRHNLLLLKNIARFHALGRPLYLGISRKSLFGELLGLGIDERDEATHVLTALLASAGVQVHRVHAVKGAKEALKLAEVAGTGLAKSVFAFTALNNQTTEALL